MIAIRRIAIVIVAREGGWRDEQALRSVDLVALLEAAESKKAA